MNSLAVLSLFQAKKTVEMVLVLSLLLFRHQMDAVMAVVADAVDAVADASNKNQ